MSPFNVPLLPGYEAVSLLGQGGMGQVLLARQSATGRMVALKYLTGSGPTVRERFLREGKLQARLLVHAGCWVKDYEQKHNGLYKVYAHRLDAAILSPAIRARFTREVLPSAARTDRRGDMLIPTRFSIRIDRAEGSPTGPLPPCAELWGHAPRRRGQSADKRPSAV